MLLLFNKRIRKKTHKNRVNRRQRSALLAPRRTLLFPTSRGSFSARLMFTSSQSLAPPFSIISACRLNGQIMGGLYFTQKKESRAVVGLAIFLLAGGRLSRYTVNRGHFEKQVHSTEGGEFSLGKDFSLKHAKSVPTKKKKNCTRPASSGQVFNRHVGAANEMQLVTNWW